MKTIKELQNGIEAIKQKLQDHKSKKEVLKGSVERKLRKEIPYLQHCIRYLESNPNPSFVGEEVRRLQAKINVLMSRFTFDETLALPKSEISKLRRAHEKLYDVPKYRQQLRTLKFILA